MEPEHAPRAFSMRSSELFLLSAAGGAETIAAGRGIAVQAQSNFRPGCQGQPGGIRAHCKDSGSRSWRPTPATCQRRLAEPEATIRNNTEFQFAAGNRFQFRRADCRRHRISVSRAGSSQHLEMGAEVVMAFDFKPYRLGTEQLRKYRDFLRSYFHHPVFS